MKSTEVDVRNERTFNGVINADGTINRGVGFTLIRGSVGNYYIHFRGAKFVKSCVAQIALGGAGIITVYFPGGDTVNILAFSPGVASVDASFTFTAIALMNSI